MFLRNNKKVEMQTDVSIVNTARMPNRKGCDFLIWGKNVSSCLVYSVWRDESVLVCVARTLLTLAGII